MSSDERQQLVWCSVYASLFKFETGCEPGAARRAAAAAYAQYGSKSPFQAVSAGIRSELKWPAHTADSRFAE